MSTATTERPKTKLKQIPVSQIRESDIALRKVDKESQDYLELVDSVRQRGIYNPILVRELKDEDGKTIFYGLVDGLQRWNAAMDAGLDEVPAQVYNMVDAEVLEAQIIANVQKIETKPVEFTQQLRRIFGQNPTLTLTDMANKLSKSTSWVSQRLKLAELPEHVGSLVDEGKIKLANAYALVDLVRLAPDEVDSFLDRAQTLPPTEFAPVIQSRVSAIKVARRAGKDKGAGDVFTPVPHLQSPATIKSEFNDPKVRDAVLDALGAKTPKEGWQAALAWACHMDPLSVAEGKRKFEAEKAAQEEAKRQRAEEKERKKLEAAAAATQGAIG